MSRFSRYRDTGKLTVGQSTYYSLRQSTAYPLRNSDVFYDVQPYDTLHKIAYLFFRNAELWWVVADFNDKIDPFEELVPGDVLRLPSSSRLWMEVLP
jgi:nucleoid-associated protein YgaU